MKTTLGVVAISAALTVPAAAQHYGARPVREGMPVVLIGQISSQPRDFGFFREGKLQVAIGPEQTDHTLHLNEARIYDAHGRELAKSDLLDKWWVRVGGTIGRDPRRIRTMELTVLGKDPAAYRRSAFYIPGKEYGYVAAESVAGVRQVLPTTRAFAPGTEVMLLAPVSSQPKGTGVGVEEKLQVAIGPDKRDYTLHLRNADLVDLHGQEIYLSGLRDRMWVRAVGRVMDDSRRVEVAELTLVADVDESWRMGPFFPEGSNFGMIVSMEPAR
jgi:hypothetical protein